MRQTYFERLGVVEAVLSSFHYSFTYILEFKSWPLVGALVLWGVIFWYSAPKIKVKVKYPWIVSVLSYCVFSAMFCPTSYAMNSEGEGRTVNIYFYAYILFAVINCLVWVVWLRSIYDRRKGGSQNERGQGFSMVVLALVCFAISYFPYDTISDSARYSLSSGEAQQYWACGQERLVILKDSSIKDAELDRYPVKPYLLYFVDITEDKDNWKNTDCAGYYEKDSVVLKG